MKRRSACRSGGTGIDGEATANQAVRATPALAAAANPRKAVLLKGRYLMAVRQVDALNDSHSVNPALP